MNQLSRALLASFVLVALAAAPLAASAQSASEADGHFKRGVELYKEADYRAALIEFRRAYELAPAYQVLYNIAETDYQLQDYAGALKIFEQYMSDGGVLLQPDRRVEVEKEIGKLRLRVARVTITTSAPDVEITIDDVAVGKTPLAQPVLVSAGRRRVVATKAGKAPVVKQVDVAGGDALAVALEIPADDKPAVVAPPPDSGKPPPPITPESKGSVPVWPWVTTGVLGAGAVVTGVLALGASSDLKTKLAAPAPNAAAAAGVAQDVSDARSKTKILALTTDILTGVTVAMAGVSIYLTVAGSGGSKDNKPGAFSLRPREARAPEVRVGVRPGGVEIVGMF